MLGGKIHFFGRAAYLDDTVESSRISRVTLHYSKTTHTKQLNMDLIKQKLKYRDKIRDMLDLATHFVSKILYGGGVDFVFYKKYDTKEEKQSFEGKFEMKANLSSMNETFNL